MGAWWGMQESARRRLPPCTSLHDSWLFLAFQACSVCDYTPLCMGIVVKTVVISAAEKALGEGGDEHDFNAFFVSTDFESLLRRK